MAYNIPYMDPMSYGPVWQTGFALAELPTGYRQINDQHTLFRVNKKWNILNNKTGNNIFFLPSH